MKDKTQIDYGVRRRLRIGLGGRNSTRRKGVKTRPVKGKVMPRPRVLLVQAIKRHLAKQAAAKS